MNSNPTALFQHLFERSRIRSARKDMFPNSQTARESCLRPGHYYRTPTRNAKPSWLRAGRFGLRLLGSHRNTSVREDSSNAVPPFPEIGPQLPTETVEMLGATFFLITYEAHVGGTPQPFRGDLASRPAFGSAFEPVQQSLSVPTGRFSRRRADRMRIVRNQDLLYPLSGRRRSSTYRARYQGSYLE